MEGIKNYLYEHFEGILVTALILASELISFYAPSKLVFLSFFYLPVLFAGYFLGKRSAIATGLASVGLTVFFFLVWPQYLDGYSKANMAIGLPVWAVFLILSATLVGTLYEQREKQIAHLKLAYVGILEILSKYLESYDRYTQGHSVRVARYATEIAISMQLPRTMVENIQAAALLHDIGKVDVSLDLIQKSVHLSKSERDLIDEHSNKGAELLGLVGTVLEEAIPLVQSHHANYSEELDNPGTVPLGARVIAVADTYDALVTDRPYRKAMPPWEALDAIKKDSGRKFDPDVVAAFERVTLSNAELETSAALA